MTAEDTTQERTGPATGAVPRPRPSAPSGDPRPSDVAPSDGTTVAKAPAEGVTAEDVTAAEQPDRETQDGETQERPAEESGLNPAYAGFREEVRKVLEVRDPAPAHHAATRRRGLHRRAAVAAGRGVSAVLMGGVQSLWRVGAWRRTPVGGFVLPLVTLLVVVALAAGTGAGLERVYPAHPRAATQPTPSATPSPGTTDELPEPGTGVPEPTDPGGTPPATGGALDGLNAWAQPLVPVVGIPLPALKAYAHAQLVLALTTPACHLTWTTLAGIGKIESNHGAANGARLQPDGLVSPPIIGPALDGTGGRALIRDTDLGRLDGDRTYDHAIGPMQFLPSTWETYQVDGDSDGVRDPADLNDAALAAANYLCAGGRNLADAASWWAAILAYNAVPAYAQSVLNAADTYGRLSHTATAAPTTGARASARASAQGVMT